MKLCIKPSDLSMFHFLSFDAVVQFGKLRHRQAFAVLLINLRPYKGKDSLISPKCLYPNKPYFKVKRFGCTDSSEIYYRELAAMFVEARKSHALCFAKGSPRKAGDGSFFVRLTYWEPGKLMQSSSSNLKFQESGAPEVPAQP